MSLVTWLSNSSAAPPKKLSLVAKSSFERMTIFEKLVSGISPSSAQIIGGLSSRGPRGRVKRDWSSCTVPHALM